MGQSLKESVENRNRRDAESSQRTLTRHPDSPFEVVRQFGRDPLEYLEQSRCRYGDAILFDLVLNKLVVLSHPDSIHHVLVGQRDNYVKQSSGYKALRTVMGNGLVTSEGALWMRQRRLAQPAFHRSRLVAMADVMIARSQDLVRRWRAHGVDTAPIDISASMMTLTLEIVCETLLGVGARDAKAANIGVAIEVMLEQIHRMTTRPLDWPLWFPLLRHIRYKRSLKVLDDVVLGIISARRSGHSSSRDDLLSIFMEAEIAETGERMDDQQLRDEVMTIFLAGHETTAMNLTWTLYLLALHPKALAEVQQELADVLKGAAVTFEMLERLECLERVILESMRLYPPVPIVARSALEDDRVGGVLVPKGAYVLLPQFLVHKDPRFWDDPAEFRPARFVAARRSRLEKRAFFPFSTGQRKCIGDHFAMMEAKLALAVMLSAFSPQVPENHPVKEEVRVTLRPAGGVWMHLKSRN